MSLSTYLLTRCCVYVAAVPIRFSSSLRKLGSHTALDKLLRMRGAGSKSEVHDLLKLGCVTSETGEVLRRHRLLLRPDTVLYVNKKPLLQTPLLAVFYKPHGIQCTMKDNWDRADLRSVVKDLPILADKHPVGRLDADTSGLLLFSGSGSLTHFLLDPSNGVEREYEALVLGAVDSVLKQRLSEGVATSEGIKRAQLLHWEVYDIPHSQKLLAEHISALPYSHSPEKQAKLPPSERVDMSRMELTRLRLTATEGKYRMVRRILANSGHPVLSLHRSRFGNITLQPPAPAADVSSVSPLEPGMARLVTAEEYAWAVKLHDNIVDKEKTRKTKEKQRNRMMCRELGVDSMDELNAGMEKMQHRDETSASKRQQPTRQQQEIITQALSSTAAKSMDTDSRVSNHGSRSSNSGSFRAGSVRSLQRSYSRPKESNKRSRTSRSKQGQKD